MSQTYVDPPEAPTSGFFFDPYVPEFQTHLHDTYRTLRDDYPVYHNPVRRFWAVSRYQDVVDVLRDAETFCSAGVEEALSLEPMMIFLDGKVHGDLRNVVSRGFTPRRVDALEPRIRSIARDLLDEIGDVDSCEFMHQFAAQLPSRVIGELIGIPEDRREAFLSYTESMMATGPDGHDIAEASANVYEEFTELLAQRRKSRRDDLMSALLDVKIDGQGLSEQSLLGFCFLLVVGGNDTTMNLIGNGTALLAQHPDQRRRLVEDPKLIPEAVEEMLRIEAPTQALPRRTTRDVGLHGVTIPAESRVIVSFGAANHDERVFAEPERFDISRANKQHMSLGHGSHFCLGASLARMEGRIAFEELLQHRPSYELEEEPTWVTSRWARSHPALHIGWKP